MRALEPTWTRRLELENAFLSLWESETAGAPFGSGMLRAAGLLVELQAVAPAGLDVLNAKATARWLRTAKIETLPPQCLHHVALFWSRVHRVALHPEAGCLAVAAWSALAREQRYLVRLLDDLGANEAQRTQAIDEMVIAPILLAGHIAATALGTAHGFAAAKLLCDAPHLSLEEPWRSRVANVAERALHEAIGRALDPIEAQLDLLPDAHVLAQLVNKIDECWRCFGHHVRVERFIAQHVVDALWPVYRELESGEFLALLEPLDLAVDSLVRRTERGEEIAFLAGAVDMLAFFAFAQPDDEVAVAIYQRVLKVFPTHQNARRCLAVRAARRP